jgi:hypothetical protein
MTAAQLSHFRAQCFTQFFGQTAGAQPRRPEAFQLRSCSLGNRPCRQAPTSKSRTAGEYRVPLTILHIKIGTAAHKAIVCSFQRFDSAMPKLGLRHFP